MEVLSDSSSVRGKARAWPRGPFPRWVRWLAFEAGTGGVMRARQSRATWLVGVSVLLISCSGGTDEAKRAVVEFRARASQESFGQIYGAAAPEFRQAASDEQFGRFMTALGRKLGPWQSAPDPVWNVTRGTSGHFVTLTYQSQFAKGAATEQFVWRVERGSPVLVGYNVNSPLLVTE